MDDLLTSLKRFLAGHDLKNRATRGSLWVGAGLGTDRLLRLARNMILTRLLAPEAFGLMAIILAVIAGFESFTEVGVRQAIIQSPKGRESTLLNAAWCISVLRSVGLYILGFGAASLLASFYNNPEVTILLRISLLSVIFKGLVSPRYYIAMKDLNFKQVILIDSGGGVFGILTALALALFWIRNVWALVIGFTVEMAVRLVLSYVLCPYLPMLKFYKQNSKALLRYMSGIFGLPILTFVFMKADIFVIGKVFSAELLGLYSMAISLAQMPSLLISNLVAQVTMPAFSEVQDRADMLNRGFLDVSALIAMLYSPLLLMAVFYSGTVLTVVYGARYAMVAWPFSVVFLTWFLRVESTPISNMYFAVGQPGIYRFYTGIRAVLILLSIYPSVKAFGLLGAALAGFASMAIGFYFQLAKLRTLIGLDLKKYFAIFFEPAKSSLIIPLVWFLVHNIYTARPVLELAIGIGSCAMAYVVSTVCFIRSKDGARILGLSRGQGPSEL